MRRKLRGAIMLAGLGLASFVVAQDKPKPDAEKLFKLADENGDGKMSLDEFVKFNSQNPQFKDKQEQLKQAFKRLDTNSDGFLTLDEYKKAPFFQGQGLAKGLLKKGKEAKSEESTKSEPTKVSNTPATAEQIAFFEKKIRPVLIAECYSCHAADAKKIKGGLVLDTRDGTRKGGDTGPAVVPGDLNRSLLIKAIRFKDENFQMPPKKKLPDSVIADFETWVKMGAPDPRDGASALIKHEIDIEKGRQFWAFQTPKKTDLPKVATSGWAKTDIDLYLLAGLEAKQLKPVADADSHTLVRRLYLDITGLPPTPGEVDAFAEAFSKDADKAIAATVDKLLASPQFGERWGRHWLDVARYAESTGKAVNFNYPHAWRYRDYVIAAYNSDTPYDRFIKEQLAGDLLPASSDKEKARNIVATGFLAIGSKTLNERNRLQFELDVVDEQIDVFSQAFLGMTAACARCHDHKFDPIPTKDYYALAGIFRSTETCYGTIRLVQANHPSPLITLPVSADIPAGLSPLTSSERADLEKSIKSLQADGKGGDQLTMAAIRNRIQIAMLESKLALYEKDGTPKRLAMGAREKYRGSDSPIYVRGEPEKPGDTVPRGVLSVVTETMPTIKTGSGRKELADWVASKQNPLTARVYVNRVWLHLFGRGLVSTPDNFGTTGLPPANPALLDHLALNFEDNGWSTKKLIKELVMSHAYRLSSKFDAANMEADPDNTLLWRMTPGRLDAEIVRDAMLAVSGKLDRTPPKESATEKNGDGYSQGNRGGSGFANAIAQEGHRSVYLPILRDNLPEALSLFDAADPSLVIGERVNTTVPVQALFLMNNAFVIKQSEAAGEKLLASASTDSERIRNAYMTFFSRPASARELIAAESFVQSYGKTKSTKSTWSAFAQAMFGSAEFLMRN